MPNAKFSEFTYGYAVMRETETFLTQHAGALTKAPVQPSLILENTVGYDAKLVTVDFAVLLQFKRPFDRTTHGGRCTPSRCTWCVWRRRHYRIKIETAENQHQAMRGYEDEIDKNYRRGLACYVTAAYSTVADHDSYFTSHSILEQSAAPLPSLFDGLVGEHSFSYDCPSGQGVVVSEAREVEHTSLRDQLAFAVDDVAETEAPSLATFVTENPVTQSVRLDRGAYDVESVPGAVSYLQDSAALLGAAFVLMGHKEAARP